MTDFTESEAKNGFRASWNTWPASRMDASRMAVPLGCLYTPMKSIPNLVQLPYEPVYCKDPCRATLNSFCRIDFVGKIWTCPFCFARNHLPPHYAASMSETSLPGELIPGFTTVEYQLPRAAPSPPVFMFVVDTSMIPEEMEALKQSLVVTLSLVPPEAKVGLITFGTYIQLHDLSSQSCGKAFVFHPKKEITAATIQDMLGLFRQRQGGGNQAADSLRHFIMPRSECEYQISTIIEDLQPDPWPVATGARALRCTGAAMSVATGLLELGFQGVGCRILTFISGPCTVGEGTVVSTNLEERMRSHPELEKGTAPHFENANKFYLALAERLVKSGHVCDLFACSLDQLGILEMRHLVEKTGGYVINHEAFAGGVQGDVFVQSLMKMFTPDPESGKLHLGFGAKIDLLASREFKVCGAIGTVASLGEKGDQVSEVEIGVGKTKSWAMAGLDKDNTVAFYFEICNAEPMPDRKCYYLQIQTQYQAPTGEHRMRVTTLSFPAANTEAGVEFLANGFDQEAAAVLTSRYVAHRARSEETFEIMRWLDRTLIKLCTKFGSYTKGDAASFHLQPQFSIFPQFIFHLRRSPFLQVFNSSPDETALYRSELNRQNVANSLVMIQPTLICYSLQGPPSPVLLDNLSIQPDRILLLDAFFWVTVWTGETIAAWRNQGYHEMPGYENVKQLLIDPDEDLKELIRDRFPVPRIIITDQHKSQARFLLARLNPSHKHDDPMASNQGASELIYTDDVSLQVFLEHLAKLAVEQS